MKPTSRRNIQLDILRGVAILLVIGRHLEIPRPAGALGVFAEAWYTIGWMGVDLFFVLSGFLIGGLLLMELDKHGKIDVLRFLIRRGLKIYPLYYVFMAYLIAMPTLKALFRGGEAWATLGNHVEALWPNLLFLHNYTRNAVGHTWSLAVEEHFYLVLPFVLAAMAAKGRIRLMMPLFLLIAPLCLGLRWLSVWTDDSFSTRMAATHLRLDALLFGVMIRGVAQYHPLRFLLARRWRGVLFIAGIAFWLPSYVLESNTMLFRTIGLTGTMLGSAAFLLATYHTHLGDFGRLARWVSPVASLLAWIGVYSYGIFVWHVTIMGILEREFGGRVFAWAGGPTAFAWLGSLLIISSAAIVVGAMISKAVEWPILRFRDRIFPSRAAALPTVPGMAPTHTNREIPVRILPARMAVSAPEDNSTKESMIAEAS